jgi:hypothetical protein
MANTYLNYGVDSTPITGRFLAHNHHNRVARAFTAADLHAGTKQLIKPTMVQAALLARVSAAYAWAAVKRQNQRAEIEAGLIPLVPASVVGPKTNGNGSALVVPGTIDDAELMHIAHVVGADRMLAAAVAMEAAQ